MDKELLELLDKEAIGETISRLFIATDRRDWEAVRAYLTDEVLFEPERADPPPAAESNERNLKYIDGNKNLESGSKD